jgi:regulator of sigma E protease
MPQILTQLLATFEYAFAIIFLLGGVIAIHELGHFLFAKWAGIRVDVFSIGFGPKLFTRKWGETEYCLSLIPLGGFVKIYGQDPEEVANDPTPSPDRAFVNKSLGQKVSVLFGGPLFNYLLAIFIFSVLAVAGVQKLPAMATRVIADTPAYEAGLRSGDAITAINGQPTKTFEEVVEIIANNPEKELQFSILRSGAAKDLTIRVQKEQALTPYGEQSVAGVLEGLDPFGREPILATTLDAHPWGFKNGDRITKWDDVAVGSWEDLEDAVSKSMQKQISPVKFSVRRGKEDLDLATEKLDALYRSANGDVHIFLQAAGIFNPELFVQEVLPGSPAAEAGLLAGDRIISANKKVVHSFEHFRSTIQHAGEDVAKARSAEGNVEIYPQAVSLVVERKGKTETLVSGVKATKGKDPLGETIVTYTIGLQSAGKPQMPRNIILERTFNPAKALWLGSVETVNHTVMTIVGLKKLAFGEVSPKTMGGPIMIGKLAGDTFSGRGWMDFLRIMAIISISLGVFNLLPVPILDGGHIVFAVIERFRGSPLPQSVQQTAMKVGLSLILVLIVFVFYNDLSRLLPMSIFGK